MKFILNIIRRLAALVYAVTIFPVAFAAATCIMVALALVMPAEWIITGDTKYTSGGIIFFLSDYTGYIIDIFRTISGD